MFYGRAALRLLRSCQPFYLCCFAFVTVTIQTLWDEDEVEHSVHLANTRLSSTLAGPFDARTTVRSKSFALLVTCDTPKATTRVFFGHDRIIVWYRSYTQFSERVKLTEYSRCN